MTSSTRKKTTTRCSSSDEGRPRLPAGGNRLNPLETYLAISDRERSFDHAALHEAEAIARAGDVRPGARILDSGAGQGWHAIALSTGFSVVGIDAAAQLVSAAERRAARRTNARGLCLLVASAAAVPFADASFDLAYSLHTSLGYAGRDDDLAVATELRRLLRPGASLVVQALSAAEAAAGEQRAQKFPDGACVLHEPRFDASRSLLRERQRLVLPQGEAGSFRFAVRAYDPSELLALVREAGLVRAQAFGSLELDRWREGSPVVVTARAPF
jgi:SAM-dependent methyltransferase